MNIVHAIIETFGGTLTLAETSPTGSTFVVCLPRDRCVEDQPSDRLEKQQTA